MTAFELQPSGRSCLLVWESLSFAALLCAHTTPQNSVRKQNYVLPYFPSEKNSKNDKKRFPRTAMRMQSPTRTDTSTVTASETLRHPSAYPLLALSCSIPKRGCQDAPLPYLANRFFFPFPPSMHTLHHFCLPPPPQTLLLLLLSDTAPLHPRQALPLPSS